MPLPFGNNYAAFKQVAKNPCACIVAPLYHHMHAYVYSSWYTYAQVRTYKYTYMCSENFNDPCFAKGSSWIITTTVVVKISHLTFRVCVLIDTYMYMSICRNRIYTYLSIHLSINLFIHPSIHPILHTYIHTYITLRYATLRYVTLRCITLHCITLHYITLL